MLRPPWRTRIDALVQVLDLGAILGQPVRQLSLGQRMRAEILAALIHEPQLVFLDEPTIGLDAPSKLALRAFLMERNRSQGTTVLLPPTTSMTSKRCARACW